MNIDPKLLTTTTRRPSFGTIDRSIRTLTGEIEQANTLLPETQSGRVERLLKIYTAIQPLLALLSTFPLIPSGWRAALVLFIGAVESLAGATPDATMPDFKAGRDL